MPARHRSVSTRTRGVIGALAVVTGLASGCGGDGGESSSPDATSAPASAGTTPAGPLAWVDALAIGPPPRIGYVIGHTYHSPDGGVVPLPRDRGYTSIARLGDGWLVTDDQNLEATIGVQLLDSDGSIVRHIGTMTGAPVLSEDGQTLRWITFTFSEADRSLWQPTRMHVADVATGTIRSRVIERHGEIRPSVPHPEGSARVWAERAVVVVLDPASGEQVTRLPSPGRWIRGRLQSAAWEDRAHLLVSVRVGARTAILRVDVRSGDWSLAVDWTPMERSYSVVFETSRID